MLILLLLGEGEVQCAIELWFYPVISEKTHNLVKQLVSGHPKLAPEVVKHQDWEDEGNMDTHSVEFEMKSGAKLHAAMPLSMFRTLVEGWLVGKGAYLGQ